MKLIELVHYVYEIIEKKGDYGQGLALSDIIKIING